MSALHYRLVMEIVVDVAEAAERLEELVGLTCAGDEVSISVDGIPMVRLVSLVTLEEFRRLADQD